jgi:hypothetical protein
VPWLRSLVAGLSPRSPGFAPGSIHVGFVVVKVALGRFFSEFLGFPPSIYHSTVALQTHIIWAMCNMLAKKSRHPRLGLTHPTFRKIKNLPAELESFCNCSFGLRVCWLHFYSWETLYVCHGQTKIERWLATIPES